MSVLIAFFTMFGIISSDLTYDQAAEYILNNRDEVVEKTYDLNLGEDFIFYHDGDNSDHDVDAIIGTSINLGDDWDD